MKKIILLAIAGVTLAFWACSRPGHVQNEAEFKGRTGVIGVFRQPAFYCEATPHYMHLGDTTVIVKPTWSNEQDNVFFAPLKPGTATLYSYSYDCGSSDNRFVLDTTANNKGASGVIVPDSGFCKIVISFLQGEKLFTHNDILIEEEFKKAKVALNPSNIPYCEVVKVDGSKLSFANRDSLIREQYKAAVEAAKDGGCDQVHPLVVIDSNTTDKVTWNVDKSRVLMVAAHATPDLFENGMSVTVDQEMRVFSDREVLEWYRMNGKDVRNWPLRLRQLLGLPREEKITHFTTFWVEPKDLIRPAYTPDIASTEMACRFEDGDDSQLDSLGMWLRNWFDKNWAASYKKEGGYPWTRLGYTYDWGADGNDKYGVSEFLLMNESKVTVQTTKDLKSFVRWLGDRNRD